MPPKGVAFRYPLAAVSRVGERSVHPCQRQGQRHSLEVVDHAAHVLPMVGSSTPCRRPAPAIQPCQQPRRGGAGGTSPANRASTGLVPCVTCYKPHQVTRIPLRSPMRMGICDLVTCVTHINRTSHERIQASARKKPGSLAGLVVVWLLAVDHAARLNGITSAPVRSLSR